MLVITIIHKILSRFRNPTKDWPAAEPRELVFDLNQQTINGCRINSRLELAHQFGKASYVRRFRKEYLDLFYPRSGLILEFASDELMAITVIVSMKSFHIREDEMGVGKIKIIDTLGEEYSLNDRTVLKDLVAYLGNPVDSGTVGPDMAHTFI